MGQRPQPTGHHNHPDLGVLSNCGARRGERRSLHTYDDGEHYWVDTWCCSSSACGHVDHYTNVVIEAERIAAATPVRATAQAEGR